VRCEFCRRQVAVPAIELVAVAGENAKVGRPDVVIALYDRLRCVNGVVELNRNRCAFEDLANCGVLNCWLIVAYPRTRSIEEDCRKPGPQVKFL
jgi:hypothetical protein